jgi:hypothetical protein
MHQNLKKDLIFPTNSFIEQKWDNETLLSGKNIRPWVCLAPRHAGTGDSGIGAANNPRIH